MAGLKSPTSDDLMEDSDSPNQATIKLEDIENEKIVKKKLKRCFIAPDKMYTVPQGYVKKRINSENLQFMGYLELEKFAQKKLKAD